MRGQFAGRVEIVGVGAFGTVITWVFTDQTVLSDVS